MSAHGPIQTTAELLQLISAEQAWHYRIVPGADNGRLEFWADEAKAGAALQEELEMLFDRTVHLRPVPEAVLQKALGTHYRKDGLRDAAIREIRIDGEGEDFLVKLIREARTLGSSDIHIEPYEERNRIRMRIDGMLVERYVVDPREYPGLVNKVKIKAHLDIAEKRLPQDGRIYFENAGDKFDIRVSVLPTLYGEKVVMRILRNDASQVDLEAIGINATDLKHYLEGVRKPHGIILVSGPTGSGKTTTLYATLKLLNKESRNILTVEDPIEYTLEGINQVQVKDNIGLTFAKALRTFLRQDPDIIMVGEIRDAETAAIAIRAALTGHLVLSTIHTNSAWGTVSRLVDMGMQPFLLASTLNTSVAQRLVRLLCPDCKTEEAFEATLYPRGYQAPQQVTTHCLPQGCEECHFVGYRGRRAIFEVIPVDYEVADHIRSNKQEVAGLLKEKNVRTLDEQAFNLFARGETSLEEVYSILTSQ